MDIARAVQVSAFMFYVSRPVEIDERYYLDGGCCVKISYRWALNEGFEHIVAYGPVIKVIVKKLHRIRIINRQFYRQYPRLAESLPSVTRDTVRNAIAWTNWKKKAGSL